MRRLTGLLSFCAVLLIVPALYAGTNAVQIVPTTTLAAETGNNTSAAATFSTQTNGNIGATNISKVAVRSLLYPGSNTLIWAHFMGWFGPANHMNVGYTSSSPTQVHSQVSDAMGRGISAFVEDWYGPNNSMPNNTALALKTEAESRAGQFFFGLMYDGGALSSCHSTAGCDLTQQAIKDLTYAYNTFETSTAYLRLSGRPVVMFFTPDRYGTLNWSLIASSVPGNPVFIFEDNGGFTHANTSGSFGWVHINSSNASDWAQSYLDSFFATAQSYPAEYTWAPTYKGFNDTLAAWTANRIMNQNCGQTWLNTFNEANRYYNAARQLEAMQLVTWNDYEEGTELESGIDNCVSLAAAVSGSTLSWSLNTGAESTIDHYTVFISTDGQNLMSLGDVAAGVHSFNLGAVALAPATYTVYVKAVGRPSMTNKMSPAVTYAVPDVAPSVNVGVSPSSGVATLTVSASATAAIAPGAAISASSIDFGDGTVAAGLTASHAYRFAGSYTVKASVTDSFGLTSSASSAVTVVNQPPVAVISITPISGTAPLSVTASTAASSDPDGAVTSSTIDFGDGTIASGPTATHVYSNPGAYTVKATVYDNLNASSVATQTVTASPATPTVIPHTGWKLLYADSQETLCENGAATYAFDGNYNTKWVTQWCPGAAAMPHEMQIDLRGAYQISGFQYLPRQDGGTNGDIKGYNFFISADGVNWSQVSTGNLITDPNDHTAKQVTFTPATARYIRFQATSEVNGGPWAVVADFNVLGTLVDVASATQIPETNWRLLYADSQETQCEDGRAANTIDNSTTTKWVTQWCLATAPMPHEVQIDLGASHSVTGFQYLPRQDGGVNGAVRGYNFYVSADGVNWGAPVASGQLITRSGDDMQKQVTFPAVTGRYVRFQATSEVNGNPWAAAAELHVLGQ